MCDQVHQGPITAINITTDSATKHHSDVYHKFWKLEVLQSTCQQAVFLWEAVKPVAYGRLGMWPNTDS